MSTTLLLPWVGVIGGGRGGGGGGNLVGGKEGESRDKATEACDTRLIILDGYLFLYACLNDAHHS